MNIIQSLSVIVFVITIFLIATERIDRVYAALLAAGAMFLIGAVAPHEFLNFIDIEILGTIIGMTLLVNGAEKSGIFNSVAVRILKASRSPTSFAIILLAFTAFLSMILNNIGAMLISASITIIMTRALKMKSELFLIFQAIIANIGGMMLLMSSIPNIIIAIAGEISFNSFAINIIPLAILLFIVTTLIFLREVKQETLEEIVQHQVSSKSREESKEMTNSELKSLAEKIRTLEFSSWVDLAVKELGGRRDVLRQNVTVLILTGTILGFIVYDRFGLTPVFVALTGGVLMMIYSYNESSEALREVDWSTIFFLAGLFTMINGMNNIGLIDQLSKVMLDIAGRWPPLLPITVMWLSAFPSALIDNIPLTATFAPIIRLWVSGGLSKNIWWGLVVGANLGGNLTPIGSPSNILVVGVSKKEGAPINLSRFFKYGFLITIIHLVISMLYLYILYVIL
jgi:Na+/H+ antiporter NhaD/arsenite permease-like protein